MSDLKKDIGLLTLVALGVGGMVGSGIFALPAAMAAVAGPGLIIAIIITGLMATFLAIAYAELGAAFPVSGGPYALPRLAMGDLAGFIMGWGYFFYLFIGTAAIIDIFVVYLGYYIPGLAVGETLTWTGTLIAVAFLWLFTIINVFGVKWGGIYAVVTTIAKLLALLVFGIIGLAFGLVFHRPEGLLPLAPYGLSGITIAVTLFFWSFTGFEAIILPTGEVKDPERNVPLAMILTMLITIVVYVFVAFVFVAMVGSGWEKLGLAVGNWKGLENMGSPLAQVSGALGLLWLAAIATLGGLIATGGAGGDWVLLQARLPYAMAEDKLFMPVMSKINKFGTPAVALIFTSVLTTAVMLSVRQFPSVALMASVAAILPYAAAALSVPILRKTRPEVNRPFKLPFPVLTTAAGFVFATLLIYWATWPWTLVGTILLFLGYPAFLFVRRNNFEFSRNAWIPVYMIGLTIFSYLGYRHLIFMPFDIMVLIVFALIIFSWAYFANIKGRQ
ncbi:MAG: APC family permease [Candidatus Margulisiibacteriota bacterium]